MSLTVKLLKKPSNQSITKMRRYYGKRQHGKSNEASTNDAS